jgi:hypothetical protein
VVERIGDWTGVTEMSDDDLLRAMGLNPWLVVAYQLAQAVRGLPNGLTEDDLIARGYPESEIKRRRAADEYRARKGC